MNFLGNEFCCIAADRPDDLSDSVLNRSSIVDTAPDAVAPRGVGETANPIRTPMRRFRAFKPLYMRKNGLDG